MSFVKALGLVFPFCCQTLGKSTQAQPSPGPGLVLLSTFGIMGQPNVGKSTQTGSGLVFFMYFNVMGHPNLKRPTQTQPNPGRGLISSAMWQPNLGKNNPDPAKTCRASGSYIVGSLRNGDVLALFCGISLAFIVAL